MGEMRVERYDTVIRGGTIVDGSGSAPYPGDLALKAGLIAAVGTFEGEADQEIDAAGCIVTPGFVDIHTHYDGQVTWDTRLAPSSQHGVTTAVFGNCGVGFAPARPHQRELLIEVMEGVEDIPGVVMAEGVPFDWETFPEYLDALERRACDIDFAAQVPHSPLRVYVMGDRGAAMEPPTAEDLTQMRRLVCEAVEAGALGVSTSRSIAHRFPDGRPVPSVQTPEEELTALALGLRDAGTGVFQINPDLTRPPAEEFAMMRRLAEVSGRPLSFTLMAGGGVDWHVLVEGLAKANAQGVTMRGQSIPRSVGILFGLEASFHPFSLNPSYRPLADLPLAEKVARMRDPELRRQLLSEAPSDPNPIVVGIVDAAAPIYSLGSPPNYLPPLEASFAHRARAQGRDVREVIYDALLEDDGRAILFAPKGNVVGDDIAAGKALFKHEHVLLGLGDGGAHYGMVCDGSLPTFFLTACVRDAEGQDRIDLPRAIQHLTSDTARAVGLDDRGLLRPGYKADVNVIDLQRLSLGQPVVTHDLPAGGRRIGQGATGYVATFVSGELTYREGQPTGALPGRLVRGARQPATFEAAA